MKSIDEAEKTNRISKSVYAYNNMGAAYKGMGQTDKAIEAFLEGYRLDNKCTFIIKSLAETYYEVKDFKNAKFYYEEYLKYNIYADNKEVRKKLDEINSNMKSSS